LSDTTFIGTSETPALEFSSGGEKGAMGLGDLTRLVTTLRADLTKLQEEVKSIHTKLDACSASPHSTRSWASITESGTSPSLSRATSTESLTKQLNCVRISTEPQSGDHDASNPGFTSPIDSANTHIRNALLNANATKDVQVAGVGTSKTGYVVRFKDQESAETARTKTSMETSHEDRNQDGLAAKAKTAPGEDGLGVVISP